MGGKGFNQLHNLAAAPNRLNEGKNKKESNSNISEPHISYWSSTVPETSSLSLIPHLPAMTKSSYMDNRHTLLLHHHRHVLVKHSSSPACTVTLSVCVWTTPRKWGISFRRIFCWNKICLPTCTSHSWVLILYLCYHQLLLSNIYTGRHVFATSMLTLLRPTGFLLKWNTHNRRWIYQYWMGEAWDSLCSGYIGTDKT